MPQRPVITHTERHYFVDENGNEISPEEAQRRTAASQQGSKQEPKQQTSRRELNLDELEDRLDHQGIKQGTHTAIEEPEAERAQVPGIHEESNTEFRTFDELIAVLRSERDNENRKTLELSLENFERWKTSIRGTLARLRTPRAKALDYGVRFLVAVEKLMRREIGTMPWVRHTEMGVVTRINKLDKTCRVLLARDTENPGEIPDTRRISYGSVAPTKGLDYPVNFPYTLPLTGFGLTGGPVPDPKHLPWIKVPGRLWLYYPATDGGAVAGVALRIPWPPNLDDTPEFAASDSDGVFIGVDGTGTIWFSEQNSAVRGYELGTTTPSRTASLPPGTPIPGEVSTQRRGVAVDATPGKTGVLGLVTHVDGTPEAWMTLDVTYQPEILVNFHVTGPNPAIFSRFYRGSGGLSPPPCPLTGTGADSHYDYWDTSIGQPSDGIASALRDVDLERTLSYYRLDEHGVWELMMDVAVWGGPLITVPWYHPAHPAPSTLEDTPTKMLGIIASAIYLFGQLTAHAWNPTEIMTVQPVPGIPVIPYPYTGVVDRRIWDHEHFVRVNTSNAAPRNHYLWTSEDGVTRVGVGAVRYPDPRAWRGAEYIGDVGVPLPGQDEQSFHGEDWQSIPATSLVVLSNNGDRALATADTYAQALWALDAEEASGSMRGISAWDRTRSGDTYEIGPAPYDLRPSPPDFEPHYYSDLSGLLGALPVANPLAVLAQEPAASQLVLATTSGPWKYSTDSGATWQTWPWGRAWPSLSGWTTQDAALGFIVQAG